MEERCEVPSEVVATPIAPGLTRLAPLSVLDGIALGAHAATQSIFCEPNAICSGHQQFLTAMCVCTFMGGKDDFP